MNGVKELILSFASSRQEFSTDELWDWISQGREILRNTVNITLSRLVSKGEIVKVSRGVKLCHNKLSRSYRVKACVMCKDFLCHGHSHLTFTP